MKTILLMTTAAVALASAAQADVSFVKGEASISYNQISEISDFALIDTDVSAAFSMGTYGFQFGGSNTTFDYSSGPSYTVSSTNAHLYHQAENGNKYGAYYSTDGYFFGGSIYGVEGMASVGPMDVEAYAGLMSFNGMTEFGLAGVAAYYEIAPGIEVNAAYDTIFETNGSSSSIDTFSLGGSYDIPNTNLSATVNYSSSYDGDVETYGLGIQWNFGPNQSERLFGDRAFSLGIT
jgi:hypothetical protein